MSDPRDELLAKFRDTLGNTNWWDHSTVTRKLERLLAEHDGTLQQYQDRIKKELEREKAVIRNERDKLDKWERQLTETAGAMSGHAAADRVDG